jgi:hypothetical protein
MKTYCRSACIALSCLIFSFVGAAAMQRTLAAQDAPTPLLCPNGVATVLTGSDVLPFESLLVYLANRSVGGGTSAADGTYRLSIVPHEPPGIYDVEVRSRTSSDQVYDRFLCHIDVPIGGTPTPLPTATSPAPQQTSSAVPESDVTPMPTEASSTESTVTPALTDTAVTSSPTDEVAEPTATTAATATAEPTEAVPTAAANTTDLEIIALYPGDPSDGSNLGYVLLSWEGGERYALTGWQLVNTTQDKTYIFPELVIGLTDNGDGISTVEIRAEVGTDRPQDGVLFWGQRTHPWASGDRVVLRDSTGLDILEAIFP